MHVGAQLRGLRAPCERFAPWVTPGPRITRFRLAADLGRMGLDTHRVSNKVSKITSRPLVPLDRAFPAHALVHDSKLTVNDPNPEASHRNTVRLWPTELGHLVQDVTRDHGLGHSPASGPGAKPIPDNRFVPKERILHPRLEMVAGLLLPAAPAERPHVRDRAISSARPRPTPRHPRGLGRWNHDSRVTPPRRVVERDRIVGRASGHPCDLIVDRLKRDDRSHLPRHRIDARHRARHGHGAGACRSHDGSTRPQRRTGRDGRGNNPGRARQSSGVNPDDACVRAILVSRYREQTLNRYDQDRAPQEEHEIRDDPGHHLPDVGDPSHGVCRYDQRYRR